MTTFQDGPAKGQRLMLRRAAHYLRVVESGGKFDALDQPDDQPEAGERLFAYEIVGEPSMCHIRASGGRGGSYPIATYRLVADQPADADMRTTQAWHSWCARQVAL